MAAGYFTSTYYPANYWGDTYWIGDDGTAIITEPIGQLCFDSVQAGQSLTFSTSTSAPSLHISTVTFSPSLVIDNTSAGCPCE